MVTGLNTFDAPFFAGKMFGPLFAPSTTAFIITVGSRLNGSPCTVHLVRSLMVRMDLSTSWTWSSASATFRLIGKTSFSMHLNSWSASSRVTLKPLAMYMFTTAMVSISRVFFDLFLMGAMVRNFIHCDIV
jgi:hypothetical protein